MSAPEQVAVTQAGREAACAYLSEIAGLRGADAVAAICDDHPAIQAFVRHRIAAEAESAKAIAELVEGLDRAVKVIRLFKDGSLLSEGVHTGLRKGTDAPDAPEIWGAISRSQSTAWCDAINFALDPYFTMWGGDKAITHALALIAKHGGGRPCRYCQNGQYTGLPGNACENCMNTGVEH